MVRKLDRRVKNAYGSDNSNVYSSQIAESEDSGSFHKQRLQNVALCLLCGREERIISRRS